MTIIACARRLSDGLLTWPQVSPETPEEAAMQQKAVNSFGGVLADYELITLTPAQHAALIAGMPARPYFNSGELTVGSAPSISSDKSEIQDDGLDEALITFDVNDAAYSGNVTFVVFAPDGTRTDTVKAAAAGVATLTLTTLLTGEITVDVRALAYGDGLLTITGI